MCTVGRMNDLHGELRRFLSRPDLPADTMSIDELRGFLFTVAVVPAVIGPEIWVAHVFGGGPMEFVSAEERSAILAAMEDVYEGIAAEVSLGRVQLPPDCGFCDDVLANLDEDAPVSRWSRGFSYGHVWLINVWERYLEPRHRGELIRWMLALMFFTKRGFAESSLQTYGGCGWTLERMAMRQRDEFPHAMRSYAELGLELLEHGPRDDTGVAQVISPN